MPDRANRIRPAGADSGSTKGGGFGSIVGDSAENLSRRCRRCGHPITAEKSLRWLLGPDCRKVVERVLGCPLAEVERVDGSWSA